MDMTQNSVSDQHDSTQHYEVLQELGDCYASMGNGEQAQQCYEKAAVLSPDAPEPYVGLGVLALQKGTLDDAEVAFKVACRLDGRCAKACVGLGMVAQQRGNYRQAFEMYLRCLELDTDNLLALLGLFQASCQMGSFAKVTYYLEVYLDMHPGDVSVMFPLAALYMKDGRFEDSRKVLQDLLALDKNHKDAADLLEEVEHSLAQVGQMSPMAAACGPKR